MCPAQTNCQAPEPPGWSPSAWQNDPSFSVLLPALARFSAFPDWPTVPELDAAISGLGLVTATGRALRPVPACPKRRRRQMARANRPETPYEVKIYETGGIPTRFQNWHDIFNLAVWMTFPRTKAALNARQVLSACARSTEERQQGRVRSPEQNTLALFDEGGVILWQGQPLVFGHALHEALLTPPLRLRAITLAADAPWEELDRWMAARIEGGVGQDRSNFTHYDLIRP